VGCLSLDAGILVTDEEILSKEKLIEVAKDIPVSSFVASRQASWLRIKQFTGENVRRTNGWPPEQRLKFARFPIPGEELGMGCGFRMGSLVAKDNRGSSRGGQRNSWL